MLPLERCRLRVTQRLGAVGEREAQGRVDRVQLHRAGERRAGAGRVAALREDFRAQLEVPGRSAAAELDRVEERERGLALSRARVQTRELELRGGSPASCATARSSSGRASSARPASRITAPSSRAAA